MCEILGIEKTRKVPYNPKLDGLVERHNRSIQAMFVNECRNDWDDHLPFVMMAYRASCHDSTKCSPNLLMFGREVTFPIDLMFGDCPDQENNVCPSEYVEWLRQSAATSFNIASEQLKVAASRQKNSYEGLKPRTFNVGNLVWRWYPPTAGVKLGLGWTGPYVVLERLTDVTYKIKHTVSNKILVVHVDHLKECLSSPLDISQAPTQEHLLFTPQPSVLITEDSVFDPPSNSEENSIPEPYFTRTGRRVKPKVPFSP